MINRRQLVLSLYFLALLMSFSPAFAYLDAGTGSMMLQLVTGGVAGLAAALRLYWKQAKRVHKYDISEPVRMQRQEERHLADRESGRPDRSRVIPGP